MGGNWGEYGGKVGGIWGEIGGEGPGRRYFTLKRRYVTLKMMQISIKRRDFRQKHAILH